MDPIRAQNIDSNFDPQTELVDMNTVFDDLRAELSTEPETENVSYIVPKRPNVQITFRPVIDFDQLKLWQKRSKETKRADAEMNEKRFMMMVLAETCVGVQLLRQGKWLDVPLTFKDRQLQEMVGAVLGGWQSAIEKMYMSWRRPATPTSTSKVIPTLWKTDRTLGRRRESADGRDDRKIFQDRPGIGSQSGLLRVGGPGRSSELRN